MPNVEEVARHHVLQRFDALQAIPFYLLHDCDQAAPTRAFIADLELTVRAYNHLLRSGVTSTADVRLLGREWFLRQHNCGRGTVNAIGYAIGGW